jgi:tetratricopeptide (TPR) repeat protein
MKTTTAMTRRISALAATLSARIRLQPQPQTWSSLASRLLQPIVFTHHFSTSNGSNKIAMPDQDMELKLAKINNEISDLYKRGDFSAALKKSQDYLQQTQKHFGQDHPATASALNNVGLMQKLLGNFVEARQHYTAAMRAYAKIVGRDHASYAMTLHNLGNLNKSQVHFDTSLRATDRLTLVEQALEYFEEALFIRQAELGHDHPLTIATRSSIGSTLAAQVLHEYKMVSTSNTSTKYVSLNANHISEQQWKAAEDHLREALQLAMDNPRGRTVAGKKTKGKQKRTPPKSKQDQSTIQTLSAALAAQNLAVVLKSRAMTVDDSAPKQELLQDAQRLYEQVLDVRLQLLPSKDHPDVYATKYSLAELWEVMGDTDKANVLRQEILDSYQPSEMEEEEPPKPVVVEKTKATKHSE